MALIKCESCGQMISDRAVKCPKCGAPLAKKGENIPSQDSYTNDAPKSSPNNPIIIILCAIIIALIIVGVFLFLRPTNHSADTTLTPIEEDSLVAVEYAQPEYAQPQSTENSHKIVGYKIYKGDIEGIICYFNIYFEGDRYGEQQVYGTYYYKKSGSNNTLDLRGTYNDNTRTLFLREYLENGSPHAYMELKKSTYNNDFYGTFTRHNGAKMSINMTKIN